jgi:hypothetical protein
MYPQLKLADRIKGWLIYISQPFYNKMIKRTTVKFRKRGQFTESLEAYEYDYNSIVYEYNLLVQDSEKISSLETGNSLLDKLESKSNELNIPFTVGYNPSKEEIKAQINKIINAL